MAKRAAKQQPKKGSFDDLSPQTKQAIAAVSFVVLGIFFILSLFGYAGMVGTWTNVALDFLFGGGAYLAPFICGFYVYAMLNPKDNEPVSYSKIIGIALLFLSSLSFLSLYEKGLGGIIGTIIELPLAYLAGGLASGFIIGALLLIGLFLTFNVGLHLPKRAPKEEIDSSDFESLVLDPPLEEPIESLNSEAIDEESQKNEQIGRAHV